MDYVDSDDEKLHEEEEVAVEVSFFPASEIMLRFCSSCRALFGSVRVRAVLVWTGFGVLTGPLERDCVLYLDR